MRDEAPLIDIAGIDPADLHRTNPLLDRLEAWGYRSGVTRLVERVFDTAHPPVMGHVRGVPGSRAAGQMLRTGHVGAGGQRLAIAAIDYRMGGRLAGPMAGYVHGFDWLRDLAVLTPREECPAIAADITGRWLAANPLGKAEARGASADAGIAGTRLSNWILHRPMLAGTKVAATLETRMDRLADHLDRAARTAPGIGAVAAWCAVVAHGLLRGSPARLRYGEAGMLEALGRVVGEDGGVLSRSPADQMRVIAALIDCRACYEAAGKPPPVALARLLALLFPPLLALRHADGGLGSWQGSAAIEAVELDRLRAAGGLRARAVLDAAQWGYQVLRAGDSIVQLDAAPPPPARMTRTGCASTLAFELSHADHRLIVNCGGASLAGGALPSRIEQGLRGSAAHSTLVLDDANSTAVLLKGATGKGVETLEVERRRHHASRGGSTGVTAAHDGYGARYGLLHERELRLRDDGLELTGEDRLVPIGGQRRGKIACAIRFHCGPDVRVEAGEARALLSLPDGGAWRFVSDDPLAELHVEDSLWVDGEGRPHTVKQLVIEGLASRSGHGFAWRLVKMG